MSRPSRKPTRSTIRDARDVPRALRETGSRPRTYPAIHELLGDGRGEAWRTFLASTLRDVLRPAAIASAVGLAAGCGGSAPTNEGTSTTTTTTVQTTTTTPDTTTTTADVQGVQTVVPVTDIPCAGVPPPMQVGQAPPAPAPAGHHHHPQQPAIAN